jgi:uroporphyrinogen III methyltransferase/synthase
MAADVSGIVFLVGAGPGDPELITVKAARLLEFCDAIVYDALVSEELVMASAESAARHYVGKRSGHHALPQEEINQLLVKLAREGKNVVRLKGGDPFVFGRGGEEARYLQENEVPFAFVPGVTAGIAGAGAAGIPVTDRTRAATVVFVTGHRADDQAGPAVDWSHLAGLSGATLVVYMGVGQAEHIVQQLLESGSRPDQPAAAIEQATRPSQRVVRSSLAELPAKMKAAGVKAPALIVIGDVVGLQTLPREPGDRPLAGMRVMITRPVDQAGDLYRSLRRLGAEILPTPTIATRELEDSEAWERVLAVSGANRWLVFTSENGVRYFLHQVVRRAGDIRFLGPFRIAAVGHGTDRALRQRGLKADFVPTEATVAELARQMAANLDMKGAEVVRVQGNLSDDTVARTLETAGAKVIGLTVYETYTPVWPEGLKEKLLAAPPDIVMFSSGSTADGLAAILSDADLKTVTADAVVVSIGPVTSERIRSHGMNVTVEAEIHSIPAMVDQLVAYIRQNLNKGS